MTSKRIRDALRSRQRHLRLTRRSRTNRAHTRRHHRRHRNHLRSLTHRLILHHRERRSGLINPGPPLRQHTTKLEPSLRSSRRSNSHLPSINRHLRHRKLHTLNHIKHRRRSRRSQRIRRTHTHINPRNNRNHTLRLRHRRRIGHHTIDHTPALRKIRSINPIPRLRRRSNSDTHPITNTSDNRLPIINLLSVLNTRNTRLTRSSRINRTHPRLHNRNHRHHIPSTRRLNNNLGERERTITIRNPPLRQVLLINLLPNHRRSSHLDRHLIPSLGELWLGIGDALAHTDRHGGIGWLLDVRRAHSRAHVNGGEFRGDRIRHRDEDAEKITNLELSTPGIRNTVGEIRPSERRITKTGPGHIGFVLSERDNSPVGNVVQSRDPPLARERENSAAFLTLVGVAVPNGENRVIRNPVIIQVHLRRVLRLGPGPPPGARRDLLVREKLANRNSIYLRNISLGGSIKDTPVRISAVDMGVVVEERSCQNLLLDLEIDLQDVDVLIGEIGSVGVSHVDGVRIVIDLHGSLATGPTRFGIEGLAAVRGSRVPPALLGVADPIEGDAVLLHGEGGTGQPVLVLDRECVPARHDSTRNGDGPFDTIGRGSGQDTFVGDGFIHNRRGSGVFLSHNTGRFHPTRICHQAMRGRRADPCSRYAHQCRHEQSN